MLLMVAHSGSPGGVTFRQLLPASRETCTRPSSEPTHSTPFSSLDSASAKIVQKYSTLVLSCVTGPPEEPSFAGSLRVRSGLITSQLWPSLVERCSTFEPA